MNLAVISGTGWTQYPAAAQWLVQRFAAAGGCETVLLDLPAIEREAAANPDLPQASAWPGLISFNSWVKDPRLAVESINAQAVLSTARSIPSTEIVVIDARHYSLDLIVAALMKARQAWFPLDDWHPAFAVVADDVHQLRLMSALAATFYSQPQVLTERETTLVVRSVMRRAAISRLLGNRAGRFANVIRRMLTRIKLTQEKVDDLLRAAPKN